MQTRSQAERLVYLNHQVENGDDPGDAASHAAEIDSITNHALADDYYDRNIRAKMQTILDANTCQINATDCPTSNVSECSIPSGSAHP